MSTDLNSIGSSPLVASSSNPGTTGTATPPKELHSRHGDEEKRMGNDVKSTLSSLGINVDTSSTSGKSALSSFMNTLMGTLHGTEKDTEDDNDGDDQGGPTQISATSQQQAGSNPLMQGLDSLIGQLNSGNNNSALSTLQDQFSSLTAGQGGSKVSLQDFLSAFKDQLSQGTSKSGYMIDTTA